MGKKRRILASGIEIGMIAGEDILTLSGKLLVSKGSAITDKMIALFRTFGIKSVIIEEPSDNTVSDTYAGLLLQSEDYLEFKEEFDYSIRNMEENFKEIINSKEPIDEKLLIGCIDNLTEERVSNIHLFDLLNNMRTSSDAVYVHSLNVALISKIIAKWSEFPEDKMDILIISAMLHDIGKLLIPQEILNKQGKLTAEEYAIIQRHTILGYNNLKEKGVEDAICKVALMHHERCDGSGYPMGADMFKINEFAKIVAIADVYDAMSSRRSYREEICPFEIIRIFEREGLQKYDSKYILSFLNGILDTYLHYNVLLTDGQVGEIIFINKNNPSRPIVKIGSKCIDLTVYPGLDIDHII